MSSPIVLKLGDWPLSDAAWNALGAHATVVPITATTRAEFLADLKTKYANATAIARTYNLAQLTGLFDKELIDALPASVKAISHNGAGYDQIDVEAATARGIQVSNVPGAVDSATAVTNAYLILSTLRGFQRAHQELMDGDWKNKVDLNIHHDPEAITVGILGMGGIGRALNHKLKAFDFKKILYHNRSRLPAELEEGAEYVSLEELYAQSDLITINCPLNDNTFHMVDAAAFGKMKDGVYIVNTARGAVINEKDLIAALKSGKVAGAGLDVFESQPDVVRELLEMKNVSTTPHMGTLTVETQRKMEEVVVSNVELYVVSGKVKTFVGEQKGKF